MLIASVTAIEYKYSIKVGDMKRFCVWNLFGMVIDSELGLLTVDVGVADESNLTNLLRSK